MTAKYNGWTNYETWCVSLWIDNEQSSQNYWQEQAKEAIIDAHDEDGKYCEGLALSNLADNMKEYYEENRPDLGATMWADMLNLVFSEVNWREIAQHYLDAEIESQQYLQNHP